MTYLINNTPLEDRRAEWGLIVKREDLCCPAPGPPFSKTRGVLAWAQKRYDEGARLFGVLDTVHSQGGQAVAQAAQYLGAECVGWYPVYKAEVNDPVMRPVQLAMRAMGATVYGLPAGRSAILYHRAKKHCEAMGGVMFPNALKLPEMVDETEAEFGRMHDNWAEPLDDRPWLVSASSGTIAAGVLRGLDTIHAKGPLIVHMGYSRPRDAVVGYMRKMARVGEYVDIEFIDEGYEYKDVARPGPAPSWPCNAHYDLKAFRWWASVGRQRYGEAVFWNIG